MSSLTVVGGLYRERCIWPDWNHTFGSGGRAAFAVVGHVDTVEFWTYASQIAAAEYQPTAEMEGIKVVPQIIAQTVSFEYVHSMSTPVISPSPSRIVKYPTISVSASTVLRFGMMEGTACVHANRCVYDPQSAFDPEPFSANGSHADHVAVVANRSEVTWSWETLR